MEIPITADTLGMEGNLIERRTSSAHLWSEARQQTAPTPSTSQSLTTTPVAVSSYSNIFVTPPVQSDAEHRPHLVKMKEVESAESGASKLSQIKDKHDGEIQNYILLFQIGHENTQIPPPYLSFLTQLIILCNCR